MSTRRKTEPPDEVVALLVAAASCAAAGANSVIGLRSRPPPAARAPARPRRCGRRGALSSRPYLLGSTRQVPPAWSTQDGHHTSWDPASRDAWGRGPGLVPRVAHERHGAPGPCRAVAGDRPGIVELAGCRRRATGLQPGRTRSSPTLVETFAHVRGGGRERLPGAAAPARAATIWREPAGTGRHEEEPAGGRDGAGRSATATRWSGGGPPGAHRRAGRRPAPSPPLPFAPPPFPR